MEEGKITMSRVNSNLAKDDWIQIKLFDKHHKFIINIDMELKDFAATVTGQGFMKCKFDREAKS